MVDLIQLLATAQEGAYFVGQNFLRLTNAQWRHTHPPLGLAGPRGRLPSDCLPFSCLVCCGNGWR